MHFLTEPGGLDLDEGRSHSLHVTPAVVEGNPARANGVLKLVCVKAGVDDASKQVIEDHGQALSSHHAVQSSHENSLLRVQTWGWASDVVAISQDPGNNLDLLGPHPPARDLEVVTVAGVVVLGALGQEVRDVALLLEHEVEISSRWRGVVASWPLNPDFSKLGESLYQSLLRNVPGNSAEEYLGRVGRIWPSGGASRWQLT